jgi:hypothetical protein
MDYIEFMHPKLGGQHTDRKYREDILQWLSYMIFTHSITDIRLFENDIEIKNLEIPEWN